MSDGALYRKYRPQGFKDVLGQEQVISVLQGALKQDNISHAYLFAGSRGTGKTSIARIFAREVGTNANDLYEIDAASNRGIDDIRELRDAVNTLPFESPYKVYIVDEAHMLTKEAFNALLKTLEEPPAHVIFILATTEIERLPETVVSRCETHYFKKPSQKTLKDLVIKVAKKEGLTLEHASGELIALLGDGSFRDTLGILQKIINSTGDAKIDFNDVERVLGAPRRGLVNNVIEAIAEKDLNKGVKAINGAVENGIDMKVFAKLVLQKMRFVLLLRFAHDLEGYIKDALSEEDHVFIKELADNKGAYITSATILELLNAYERTARASIPQLPLELALVKLIEQDSEQAVKK